MNTHARRARQFLRKILPAGDLESLAGRADVLESAAADSPIIDRRERDIVHRTLDKLAHDRELSAAEQLALEAIIIPERRPAIDIVQGDFAVTHADWLHLADEPVRSRLRLAIPSIGRVELFGRSDVPYGGTGFVVGADLVMTNRHVAELFSLGIGGQDLVFRSGLSSAVDFLRERDRSDQQLLHVRRVVMIHPFWDMALLQVDGLDDAHPPLTLSADDPDLIAGREIAVIGYPARAANHPLDVQQQVFGGVFNVKRLQPGLVEKRRSVSSYEKPVRALTHDASTLGGNSGSAVIDVGTGEVLALHFAGRYLDANFAVPAGELARDRHVIEAGLNFAGNPPGDEPTTNGWWSGVPAPAQPTPAPVPDPPAPLPRPEPIPAAGPPANFCTSGAGAPLADRNVRQAPEQTTAARTIDGARSDMAGAVTLTIPLRITVQLGAADQPSGTSAAPLGPTVERAVEPVHDQDRSTRRGYDPRFLGLEVPLPDVDPALCAPVSGGGHVLPYHHFSLAMHKLRRLALVTATNADFDPRRKRPEAGRDYGRDALGGLRPSDTERWFEDPRIAPEHQLPDRFFTSDGGAFDRGHIVRREDVAWGDSYAEVQLANGDTFHTTNCSPQVAGFNRPGPDGNWGSLETYITAQAGTDRLSILAGPVLAADDPVFVGRGPNGPLRLKIPIRYWKIILAVEDGRLASFAFVLQQDLSAVALEFQVDAAWQHQMVTIAALERMLDGVRFPDAVHRADRARTRQGETVRRLAGCPLADGMVDRPVQPADDPERGSAARQLHGLRHRLAAAQRGNAIAFILEFAAIPPADLATRVAVLLPGPVLEPVFANDPRFVRLIVPGSGWRDLGIAPFELVQPLRDATGALGVEPDLATDYFPERPELGAGELGDGLRESTEALGCWVGDAERPPADRAWALRKMRVIEAWAFSESQGRPSRGEGIIIAQPDTGITDHPELEGVFDETRWADLLDNVLPPTDPLVRDDLLDNPGHGTATGSVVISRGGVGGQSTTGPGEVTGSAPAARLAPIRCIESVVRITQSRVARAIEHAVDSGCHVVTMSLGGLWSRSLGIAVERAIDHDLIVLAAAGNCVRLVVWPARFERCIAVAGSNVHDRTWQGSCRGSAVDVAAPAQHVWRAARQADDPGMSIVAAGEGTSFAVALTAGVAALWLAHHGRDTLIRSLRPGERLQDRFNRLLRETAHIPADWNVADYGAGIVDALALLQAGLGDDEAPGEAVAFSSGTPLRGDQADAARDLLTELDGGQENVAATDPALLERHGLELIWLAFEAGRGRGGGAALESARAPTPSLALRDALDRPENAALAVRLGLQPPASRRAPRRRRR